ncbi:MAG: energy transducer TonB [Terriglobales bacterium]
MNVGRCISLVLPLACFLLTSAWSAAQTDAASKRKLLNRVPVSYPNLARSMALAGVVKVDAVVAPDGSVKTVSIKGGHPVLAQAAITTVRQWKWEPSAHESHELVEIRFSPPE